MTGTELYDNTLAMLFDDDISYQKYCLPQLNALLVESFAINNAIRVQKEKEWLAEVPILQTLDDPIDYEIELLYAVLPYGLASKIVYDDGDMNKVIFWQNKYIEGLQDFKKAEATSVKDVYL